MIVYAHAAVYKLTFLSSFSGNRPMLGDLVSLILIPLLFFPMRSSPWPPLVTTLPFSLIEIAYIHSSLYLYSYMALWWNNVDCIASYPSLIALSPYHQPAPDPRSSS